MKVSLISKTIGTNEYDQFSSCEIIAAIARHGTIKKDHARLIQYLMNNSHWSPLQHISFGFKIETRRSISAQIFRHRSLNGQEWCITGDSQVSFESPSGSHYSKSIKDIYDQWHNGAKPLPNGFRIPMKEIISNLKIRVYDEDKKELTTSHIEDVFFNGVKDVYEVTLKCGRKIKSTMSHKYYNGVDFVALKDLKVHDIIATNGVPLYQNREWLQEAKIRCLENKKGLAGIAEEAGVSYHTIKKWIKKFNLSFTREETNSLFTIWNKGVSGYKISEWSEQAKKNHKSSIKKGEEHHSYRGGRTHERKLITDYINYMRKDIYTLYSGKKECNKCKKTDCVIELHHIEEVSRNPFKAYDINNIEPLCQDCHKKEHEKLKEIPFDIIYDMDNIDWEKIRPSDVNSWIGTVKKLPFNKPTKKFKDATLNSKKISKKTLGYSEIVSIKHIGKEKVYDLQVAHRSHNYIANKILVHNSLRYAEPLGFEEIDLRKEHATNRQSSEESFTPLIRDYKEGGSTMDATVVINNLLADIDFVYRELIEAGVAKECARDILPLCTKTTIHITGTLRDLLGFLNVRCDIHAQKEVRDIATEIGSILEKELPEVFNQLNWRYGLFM